MARTAAPPLLAPVRRALRRGRRSLALRWLLVAGAAALAAAQASAIGEEAAAERAAWGDAVEVVVVVRDLAAGRRVTPDDVRVEARPRAVVPVGALREAPVGRTLTAGVVRGEVLVGARVAPDGLRGPAALVPEGWRAVAIATAGSGFGPPAPPLAVGDRVDVLAPDPVATDAVVVAVTDEAVIVAVPARAAPALAEAAATVAVTLALRGP